MKKIIATVILLCLLIVTFGQSVDEGKKNFYYRKFTSAENVFHNILLREPANAEAWYWLCRTYLQTQQTDRAADTLKFAPPAIQDDPYYLLAKGAVLLAGNKQQEAQNIFQQAIDKTKGKDADILGGIADIEIANMHGDLNYAINLLQNATKRDKKNASLYTSLGTAWLKLHDGTEAFKALREATEKNKNEAAAYYQLGQIFLSQKNPDMYLEYFNKAIAADDKYAPAYEALYNHYLYRDAAKAMDYFRQYAANAEDNLQQQYSYTDLLYLNNNYDSAITTAKLLIDQQGALVQPRLYKLIAYSYEGKKDTTSALGYMQQYFQQEADTNIIAKDYENMAAIYTSSEGTEDSAMAYLEKAVSISTDSLLINNYYRQLAAMAKEINDNAAQAKWLGKYYLSSPDASNVTLFNWGLAAYKAEDYQQADSAFTIYTEKYPEQGFGYFWRARSNAAIDTTMEEGLAIPHYEKLVEVLDKDSLTAGDKKWLTEAYFYLASYETNHVKDYTAAVSYFEKLLEVNPDNEQARKYMEMLEKNIASKDNK